MKASDDPDINCSNGQICRSATSRAFCPHCMTGKLLIMDDTLVYAGNSESKNVRELHMDLLLQEEFAVNPTFLQQFLTRISHSP